MTQTFNFDATDRSIVELLRQNGRATNQQIAETLGLTATTVSSRITRMEDANPLRVVAVSDFAAHGFNFLMEVAIVSVVVMGFALEVEHGVDQFLTFGHQHLNTRIG